jgi:hypothetical protein
MHFHLPKPLHGWREFAGEVGIIVLGVVIALAFEQAVERIRWNQQVDVARGAIHREMAFDLAYFDDRLRVAPCIERDLAEAQRRIDIVASKGSTPSPAVGADSPGRLLLVSDYDAQQSAQNLVHFPADELSALGLWYDQARDLKKWDQQEDSVWTDLGLLAPPAAKLGSLDLALLRRDLVTARELQTLMVINARREIARARALGVAPGPSRHDYVQRLCRQTTV